MKRTLHLSLPQVAIIVIISMLVSAVGVMAATGTIDASASPGSTSSYTLEDLYQRLVSGTDGSPVTFTEPSAAPGSGTMHDINDIMAAAPLRDDANGATSADVLDGHTFWGLTNSEWGWQTGGILIQGNVTGADGAISFAIPDGYYESKTATAQDGDLIASNILDTVTIFGVTGSITTQGDVIGAEGSLVFDIPDGYYSGRTATVTDSDLVASNILDTADIFGIIGSIPTQSDFTGGDGLLTFDVPDGYYSGAQATAYDANLLAENIKKDVTIFGVTGTDASQIDVIDQTLLTHSSTEFDICCDAGATYLLGGYDYAGGSGDGDVENVVVYYQTPTMVVVDGKECGHFTLDFTGGELAMAKPFVACYGGD